MKKTLLAALVFAFAFAASPLVAQDSFWKGTFEGSLSGIWNGTIHDNPDEDQIPHFAGEWFFIDVAEHGTLFGVVSSTESSYYTVSKGIIYDEQGNNIGSWQGYFDLGYDGVPGSRAEGEWILVDGSGNDKWEGISP